MYIMYIYVNVLNELKCLLLSVKFTKTKEKDCDFFWGVGGDKKLCLYAQKIEVYRGWTHWGPKGGFQTPCHTLHTLHFLSDIAPINYCKY